MGFAGRGEACGRYGDVPLTGFVAPAVPGPRSNESFLRLKFPIDHDGGGVTADDPVGFVQTGQRQDGLCLELTAEGSVVLDLEALPLPPPPAGVLGIAPTRLEA